MKKFNILWSVEGASAGSEFNVESGLRTGENAAPLPPLVGEEKSGDKEIFNSYVYSIEKLKADYDNVIVLDARTKEEYDQGHLPGAVHAHWTDWSNVQVEQGKKGWAEIFSNDVLKEKLGQLGIDGSKSVVIYNNPLIGWGEEGRQLWTLRVYGVNNSYILNGGLKKWLEAGGEVTKAIPTVALLKGPEPNPNTDLFASTDYFVKNFENVKILDAREDEEFVGLKTYGEKSTGRIPNSQHVWFKDFYNPDGTLQTPAQIRARIQTLGYGTDDEIVSYCTGGIRSGFATIALKIAGVEKARNYNGSFSEWVGTGQTIDTEALKY